LVHEARRDPVFRRAAAAFGLALLLVLMMVLPDPWNSRFVLYFPAILCIAAAKLAESLRPAKVLIAAGAALAFVAGLLPSDLPPASLKGLMAQPVSSRNSAPYYDGPPPGDAVGVHVRARIQLYELYGADLSRRVVYFRLPPDRLPEEMERQGIRVL